MQLRKSTHVVAAGAVALVLSVGAAGTVDAQGAAGRGASLAPTAAALQTGLLPVCPPTVWDPTANIAGSFFLDRYVPNMFDRGGPVALGLIPENDCAYQNWGGPAGGAVPVPGRSVIATAEPSTVSISDRPTTVVFKITGAALSGPYDVRFEPCLPASSRPGGCAATSTGFSSVVYRLANGAGVFTGPWTPADQSDNPYFDLTRVDGGAGCATGMPTIDNPRQGVPCSYEVRFATSPTGVPVLQKAMQVGILLDVGGGGPTTYNGSTSATDSADVLVPLLFTPGGTMSLSLGAGPGVVAYGAKTVLRARLLSGAAGAGGSAIGFYARSAGAGAWTRVGHAATSGAGYASISVVPSRTTAYVARLESGGPGVTVASSPVTVGVRQSVSLAGRALAGRLRVSWAGRVLPRGTTRSVVLQRLVGRVWRTVATPRLTTSGAFAAAVALPRGATTWRAVVLRSSAFVGTTSRSIVVRR